MYFILDQSAVHRLWLQFLLPPWAPFSELLLCPWSHAEGSWTAFPDSLPVLSNGSTEKNPAGKTEMVRLQVIPWFPLENTLNFYLIILLVDSMVCLLTWLGNFIASDLACLNKQKSKQSGLPSLRWLPHCCSSPQTHGNDQLQHAFCGSGVSIPEWCEAVKDKSWRRGKMLPWWDECVL